MPDEEFYGSVLGGHTDLLFSHPVYWLYGRAAGSRSSSRIRSLREGLQHRHCG